MQLTEVHHDFTRDLCGVDPRDPKYATAADALNADALDGGLPPGGAPPGECVAPHTPKTDPVSPHTDPPAPAAPAGWAANGATPKDDAGQNDLAVVAQRQALAEAVRQQRDAVAVNPKLKPIPPTHNKQGKVIEPGGLAYGGKPGPAPAELDAQGDPKRSGLNKALWAELGTREGGVSAINTWDTAGLTVGNGLAAVGLLPRVMDRFLKNDPDAKAALEAVGFTVQNGKFMAVDPTSGKVLEGKDAINSLKGDPKMLSRLIEVLETPEHAQKFVDADWSELKGAAGAVPQAVLDSWDQDTIVMVAHFVHWTGVVWKNWAAIGPDIAALLRAGVRHAHKDAPVGGATVVIPMDTEILLGSAHGCGKKGVSGPGPLPDDIETTSYEGHVFLRAGKTSYWHLPPAGAGT